RAMRRFVSPTFTVSVRARNPIIRTWSTEVAPATSFRANRPLESVNARRAVPATVTCAAATGAPVARFTTVPATEPPCAVNEPGAMIPNVRARLHRTEEHRMPRPRVGKRLPILPAHETAARARASRGTALRDGEL